MSQTDWNPSQNLNPAYPSADETMTDCVQDLKLFGYSETEARFLRLVALHSGVFLARQFNLFARAKIGYRVDAFVKKLKSNCHCHTYRLGKNVAMFHLHSKAIYRAIGHENLRHRRSHQAGYVKTKLLTLDFVLQNPTLRYFPTEEEKVELFTTVLNVPLSDLPVKAYMTPNSRTETLRYFVDKYPLFLSDISSSRPVVHFSYVDAGPSTARLDFVNHLRRYGPLFSRMPVIRMVYIYESSSKWKWAEQQFTNFVRSGLEVRNSDLDLVKYFQLREAWELKQYERVGSTELLFLNHARKKYTGAQYNELYSDWKRGDRTRPGPKSNGRDNVAEGVFTTYKIADQYGMFGELD